MITLNADDMKGLIRDVASALKKAELELCQLDGQIGDGDHGTTMSSGFTAIVAELASNRNQNLSLAALFELCSRTFLEAVGATVGPLYASAFRQAALFCQDKDPLPIAHFSKLLAAMATGIRNRGKAEPGDKTMLDVWGAIEQASETQAEIAADDDVALNYLLEIARTSAQSTKSMVASKGRAARLGERSLGHQDPGARSAEIIISQMINGIIQKQRFGQLGAEIIEHQ